MTTIGSASSSPDTPAQPVAPEPSRKEKQRKRLMLIWIPAILASGLVTAGFYVGARILAANSERPAEILIASPAPPPAPPLLIAGAGNPIAPTVDAPVAPEPVVPHDREPAADAAVAAENDGELMVPQAGARYLQIAAVNPGAVRKFLSGLKLGQWEVHLAPGPRPGLVRILVGPFPDPDSLARAKAELQALRPDCFIRVY